MRTLLPLLLAFGCVSKSRHELLEIQLGATRAAMSARAAQSAEDQRALEARVAELLDEVALRQAQLDVLAAELDLSATTLATANAELAGLRAQLEGGAVEQQMEAVHRVAAALDALDQVQRERALEEAQLAEARAAFAPLVEAGKVEVETIDGAFVVRVPTGQLFQEGWSTLSPRGEELVAALAAALQPLAGHPVRVEGHTDDEPRHSAEWPSNWERGFSRAITVLRALEEARVPTPLTAASAAGTRPLGDDDERNRRVELWIDLHPHHLHAFRPSEPESPEGGSPSP